MKVDSMEQATHLICTAKHSPRCDGIDFDFRWIKSLHERWRRLYNRFSVYTYYFSLSLPHKRKRMWFQFCRFVISCAVCRNEYKLKRFARTFDGAIYAFVWISLANNNDTFFQLQNIILHLSTYRILSDAYVVIAMKTFSSYKFQSETGE